MGNAERNVHINRVRPLLTKDTGNLMVGREWTPPLFSYECAEEQPQVRDTDHPEPEWPPSVLIHHQSSGPDPMITTCSGRIVKPVQRFGRTED